jgi:hypothetical protein
MSRFVFGRRAFVQSTMFNVIDFATGWKNALSLTLENGSCIVRLSGESRTNRGYADVALLSVDQAAHVSTTLI